MRFTFTGPGFGMLRELRAILPDILGPGFSS